MAKSEEKVNELMRAYARGVKRVKQDNLLRTAQSAGFIADPNDPDSWTAKKGKRKGYQVFVLLVQYSEERLKKKPLSGGLHARL